MDYSAYQTLRIAYTGADGAVLDVQMRADVGRGNGKLPTAGHGSPRIAEIWRDAQRDSARARGVVARRWYGFFGRR